MKNGSITKENVIKALNKILNFFTIHPSLITQVVVGILILTAMIITTSGYPLFAVFLFLAVQSQQAEPYDEVPEESEYSSEKFAFTADI